MKVQTEILAYHQDFIQTFIEANELDIKIEHYTREIGPVVYNMIELHYDEGSDTAYKISIMSLKNCGLRNMLEDFLIKCGISPFSLNPPESTEDRLSDEAFSRHMRSLGLLAPP